MKILQPRIVADSVAVKTLHPVWARANEGGENHAMDGKCRDVAVAAADPDDWVAVSVRPGPQHLATKST
jgi:hypothetical protein